MIKNNNFTVENIKHVVFLGYHEKFADLMELNKKYWD